MAKKSGGRKANAARNPAAGIFSSPPLFRAIAATLKPAKSKPRQSTATQSKAAARATARATAESSKRAVKSALARNAQEQQRVREQLKELRRAQKQLRQSLELSEAQSRANLKALQRGAGDLYEGAKRFILVDPKARRYFDRQTGEYISRRQQRERITGKSPEAGALDNLLGRARGRVTAEGREKLRREVDARGRQKAFAQAFKERKARELGVSPSDIRVRGDSETALEFKAAMRAASRSREAVRNGRASRAEIKRYVRDLIDLGVIDDDYADDWIDHYESLSG